MKKSHSLSVNRAGVQEEDLGAAARNSKPLYACRSQGVRPSQLCLPQLNCICTIKYARFKLIASYPGTFEKEISRIPAILVLIVTAIKDLFEDRWRYSNDRKVNISSFWLNSMAESQVRVGDIVQLSNK